MLGMAWFNTRPVRLWFLIVLPPQVVNVFVGICGVGLTIAFFKFFINMCQRVTRTQRIALTSTGILVPARDGGELPIAFDAMTRIEHARTKETNALVEVRIESTVGDFTIEGFNLGPGELEEILGELMHQFESRHRPDLARHRERFWEEEQRREEGFAAARAEKARVGYGPQTAKKHRVLAVLTGSSAQEVELAAFDSADKAEQYAQFLRDSGNYQAVRVAS